MTTEESRGATDDDPWLLNILAVGGLTSGDGCGGPLADAHGPDLNRWDESPGSPPHEARYSMNHVVHDFAERLHASRPDHALTAGQRRALLIALNTWRYNADVTSVEVAMAVDLYFHTVPQPCERVTERYGYLGLPKRNDHAQMGGRGTGVAGGHFLNFLGRNLSTIRRDAPDEAFEEYARNQVLPWSVEPTSVWPLKRPLAFDESN